MSRDLADRLWPGGDAVGRRFKLDSGYPWETVVGVVGNVEGRRPVRIGTPLRIYRRMAPAAAATGTAPRTRGYAGRVVLVRAAIPLAAVPAIRAAVWSIDAHQPIGRVSMVDDLYADAFARERFVLQLMAGFASAGSHPDRHRPLWRAFARRRTRRREIGVRMALGARPAHIMRLVIGRGLVPLFLGIVAGIAGASGLARFLRALLFARQSGGPRQLRRGRGGDDRDRPVRLLAADSPRRAGGSRGSAAGGVVDSALGARRWALDRPDPRRLTTHAVRPAPAPGRSALQKLSTAHRSFSTSTSNVQLPTSKVWQLRDRFRAPRPYQQRSPPSVRLRSRTLRGRTRLDNLIGEVRYALRQFWVARIFTITAVLTLALGIGGTTAIFTLIHAVMLRSLPVGDPSRLYRIGDGDTLLRAGRAAGSLGHVLVSAVRAAEGRAAGVRRAHGISGRRGAPQRAPPGRRRRRAAAARRVRHRQLLLDARRQRVRRPRLHRRRRHAGGGAGRGPEPSRLADDLRRRSRRSSAPRSSSKGTRSRSSASRRRGSSARRCAAIRPISGFRCSRSRSINGDTSLLRQPVSAWLRVIGRLRPGATTDGMGPRLTGILRQWMQHDSGYPANWMPDVIQALPKQVIAVVPAGAGVGIMREQYGRSLQILLGVCGLVLLIACANVANLLLARAVARRGQTAVRLALGASRRQIVTQALVESVLLAVAGGIAGLVVAIGTARLLLALAFAGTTFLPIDTRPSPLVLAFAFGLALVTGILFGAAPAWFATRTDPIDALRGAGRSTGDHSSFTRKALLVVQATVSVVLVAGSMMLARSLGNLAEPGLRLRDHGPRPRLAEPAAGHLHRREARGALSRHRGAARPPAGRARRRARALQPAHRQLGRARARRRPSAAAARRAGGRVLGSRQRQLPAEPRRDAGARAPLHRRRQRDDRASSRS